MLFPDYPLKWGEERKIFVAHNIPSAQGEKSDLLYCSETVAHLATHADNMRFRSWASPSQALSFYSVYMDGGVDYWQIAGAGTGVALTVEAGGVFIAACDPGDGALFDTSLSKMLSVTHPARLPFRCRLQSLYLTQENRM